LGVVADIGGGGSSGGNGLVVRQRCHCEHEGVHVLDAAHALERCCGFVKAEGGDVDARAQYEFEGTGQYTLKTQWEELHDNICPLLMLQH
jgi:hypothetical protein